MTRAEVIRLFKVHFPPSEFRSDTGRGFTEIDYDLKHDMWVKFLEELRQDGAITVEQAVMWGGPNAMYPKPRVADQFALLWPNGDGTVVVHSLHATGPQAVEAATRVLVRKVPGGTRVGAILKMK